MSDSRKRVGIITMHRVVNFGSALQVYGLYEAIKNLGYHPEVIDYVFPNSFQKERKSSKSLFSRIFNKHIIKNIFFKILRDYTNIWSIQKKRFDEFLNEYVKLSKMYHDRNEILEGPPKYDIVVTGSDQVWNPKHTLGDPTFFCDFADGTPKISYASSFACSELDNIYKESYANLLEQYKFISTREKNGQNIISSIIRKRAEIVCDPAMLIEKDMCLRLAEKSKIKIDYPYILAYILDYNINPHPAIENVIEKLSKKTGLRVIYLECGGVQGNVFHGNKMIFDAGPLEFLWLVSNAQYIVTSSFHGVVFSITLEKDFYAITDTSVSDDRLSSLCVRLGIENRLVINQDKKIDLDEIPIYWDVINKEVESFKKESYDYLKYSLRACTK